MIVEHWACRDDMGLVEQLQDDMSGGTVLRAGVLTPHAAAGPEVEIQDMAPGWVTVQVARIRPDGADASWRPPSSAAGLRALAEPSTVDSAAAPFRTGSVDAVVYASTTSGYALGAAGETELVEGLSRSLGLPASAAGRRPCRPSGPAGPGGCCWSDPPWFADEVDALGARYFRDQGLEVTVAKATGLPRTRPRYDPTGRRLGGRARRRRGRRRLPRRQRVPHRRRGRGAGTTDRPAGPRRQPGAAVVSTRETGVALQVEGFGRIFSS